MSSQLYISVSVCGNSQANGGFDVLAEFNSPTFLIEDRAIGGFKDNSYYFSVVIGKKQVVYKLYKNNVRSYGAIRQGILVIAFSVPKGYGFEKGVGPYKVMMALKDKFLSSCMTRVDSLNDTYEFNDGQKDSTVLDDVARQFPLIPHQGPYCDMSLYGPVGYLILPENKIEQFMNDVQYRELQKYREVFMAENVENPQSSLLVPELEIPRRPQYKVTVLYYENNTFYNRPKTEEETVADVNKQLVYSSRAESRYYDNQSISFTIKQLLDGPNPYPNHLSFDAASEEVKVSTKGLESPKVIKMQLDFGQHQNFFIENSGSLQLFRDNIKVNLGEDLSFELKGEEIEYTNRPNAFKLSYLGTDYQVSKNPLKFDENRLVFNVNKTDNNYKPKPLVYGKGQGGNRDGGVQNSAPRQLKLNIEDKKGEIFDGKTSSLKVTLKSENGNNKYSEIVYFSIKNRTNYQCKLEVPDQIQNPLIVEFRTSDEDLYRTMNPVSIDSRDGGKKELTLSNFNLVNEKFLDKKISKHLGLLGLLAAALLLLGGLSGYFLRGCTGQKDSGESKIEKGNTIFKGGEDTDDTGDSLSEELTEEQAKANMQAWKDALQRDDVTFEEIEDIYTQYEAQRDKYNQYCDVNIDCKMIEDYYRIKTLIVNGQFDQIKQRAWDKWSISQRHKIMVSNVINTNNAQIKQQLLSNYVNYNSFKDLGNNKPSASAGQTSDNKDKNKDKDKDKDKDKVKKETPIIKEE